MGVALWTLAHPSTGPGSGSGALAIVSGDIGIKTLTPATTLDVNGTTTIRGALDMTNNKAINLAGPLLGQDAINKAYADTLIAQASTTMRLWGQGRPGATVINSAGECTNMISGVTIKVSRSTRIATWDGAQAACPANWWVCTAAERGSVVCGNTSRSVLFCDPVNTADELSENAAPWGWVSNTATSTLLWGKDKSSASGGVAADRYMCSLLPVWCCQPQ